MRFGNSSNTGTAPREAWHTRGFRLRETTTGHAPSGNAAASTAVNPKILIAAGCALLFCLASFLFADAGSANEIRQKLPELHARYEHYRQTQAPASASDWPDLERRLQELAHFRQLEDWPQLRLQLAALLAQEQNRQSPVYQFCLELQAQLPAQ